MLRPAIRRAAASHGTQALVRSSERSWWASHPQVRERTVNASLSLILTSASCNVFDNCRAGVKNRASAAETN